jgi:hypothetical protein
MTFFEFSFRKHISEVNILSAINEFFVGHNIMAYPSDVYYNDSQKKKDSYHISYLCYYSIKGFETLFKGEAYEFDPTFNELTLAFFFAKTFRTEVVIGDFTARSSFLLIEEDQNIYRAAPIGIGDPQYKEDIFEINYDSLSPANDLINDFDSGKQ